MCAAIITIQSTDIVADSMAVINTNFANLDSDKVETSTVPAGGLVGVTATQTLTNKTTTDQVLDGELTGTAILDEDAFTSDSAVKVATQQSIKAYVDGLFASAVAPFKVGGVYVSVDSTNPATTLGYGTWVEIAQGETLVGVDTGDTDFNTVEKTGGSKTHTLTVAEMPAHTHTYDKQSGAGSGFSVAANGTASTNTGSTGGDGSHNNVQPYLTVYFWKRTV